MILVIHLDTGGELRVPIKYAHIHSGVLLYRHAGEGYEAGCVDLNRTRLIEFEGDDGEPDSGSLDGDGGGECSIIRRLAPYQMPFSPGQARIGFGES